jgi:hypothetical protein
VTSDLPINGTYLSHESRHSGGVSAFATSGAREVVVGDADSGTIVFGQYMDQLIDLGGTDFKRRKFSRCSRKMGTLLACYGLFMIAQVRRKLYVLIAQHNIGSGIVQHTLATQEPRSQWSAFDISCPLHCLDNRTKYFGQIGMVPRRYS